MPDPRVVPLLQQGIRRFGASAVIVPVAVEIPWR